MSVNYDEYPIEKMIKPILIILFLVVSFSGISQPYNLYPDYRFEDWREMNQSEAKPSSHDFVLKILSD